MSRVSGRGKTAAEPLRRRLRARGLVAATRAAGAIPHPLFRGALRGLAGLAGLTRTQDVILANLERALGEATTPQRRRTIAREVRCHAARLLFEWIRLSRGDLAVLDTVELDASLGILERELARGRGAIIVTAHLGNWELLAASLRRHGLDGVVVGRQRPRDSSSTWLIDMRRAYGLTTVPQDGSPRRILEVLRAGGIVGLLTDLEARRIDGAFVPFFGRPALTMLAPAALARANRSPLIPVRCVARGPQRYVLQVEEPMELRTDLPRREAQIELLGRMNRCFESWIREDPGQWAWHQPRWRTRE